MVGFPGDPEPVEEDSKFSGDRDDGSFLTVFAAALEHPRAPAFKIAVRTKAAQQVLSTLDEQRTKLFVASLADPELLINSPDW